jgi:hypothetical protein
MHSRSFTPLLLVILSSCSHTATPTHAQLAAAAETADSLASRGEIDAVDIEDPSVLRAMTFCRVETARSHDHPLDKLHQRHVRSCMTAMLPKVNRCEGGKRIAISVEVVIEGTGEVSSVLPVGPSALSNEALCVADVIYKEASFPEFNRKRLIIQYPFQLNE